MARNHKNLWRRRFESAPRGIPIEVKDIRDGVQIACAGPARSLDLCARYWCRTAAAKPEGGVDRGHVIDPGGGEGDCERDIHALPRELIGNVSGQKILRVGKVTGFIFCLRGLAPQRNRLAFLSRISVSGAFYGNQESLLVGGCPLGQLVTSFVRSPLGRKFTLAVAPAAARTSSVKSTLTYAPTPLALHIQRGIVGARAAALGGQ